MKKILLLMVAIACATMSFAQTMVATLTHGDNVKMYYGAFGYQQAMAAAEHGDVINLSAGAFQAAEITKAVSIRGVGFLADEPTYIINNFDIRIGDTNERLQIEGVRTTGKITVYGTLINALFVRNWINQLDIYNSSVKVKNALFVSCRVFGCNMDGQTSLQFVNCYAADIDNYSSTTSSASFVNCVIRSYDSYSAVYDYFSVLSSCSLTNCILIQRTPGYNSDNCILPNTTSATNCVGIGNNNIFSKVTANTNNKYADTDIFIDGDILNDLTNEAKAMYLGTDGTPVGMYGGTVPHSGGTSYPRISKLNVASKATTDGKLNVEIEVSDPE